MTVAGLTPLDGAVIVALGGDLDIASAPIVRERLLSLLRPGACRLVIDMSAVRYADASGLAALVSTQRRAVLLGGGLRLAALRPEVRSEKLGQVADEFLRRQEAVQELREPILHALTTHRLLCRFGHQAERAPEPGITFL